MLEAVMPAKSGPPMHVVEDGDGVCGDCFWCEENADGDCNVPTDPKCEWCGHCLGNHGESRVGSGA